MERNEAEARSLFQRLGYLPIGIAVAAGLVREDVRYTIAGLANNLPADAYALLREAVVALSPMAQTLMAAMAVCAPEGFRLALAAEVAELDEASSLDALQEIHSRSLVEELDRTTRRYRLHALVREAAGASVLAAAKACGMCSEGVQRLGEWLASVRRGHGRLAGRRSRGCWGSPEKTKAWSMADDVAYGGYMLTRRLGRLSRSIRDL